MPSNYPEATSTIQSANAGPAKKISSPSKVCTNDDEGTIVKKQCLSGKDDGQQCMNELPDFSELPLQIQEYIRKDNIAYQNVQRQLQNKDRYFSMKNPSNSNDSDDDPPSTCGGNYFNNINKYIY